MISKEALQILQAEITTKSLVWIDNSFPPTLQVEQNELITYCNSLYSNPKTFFDQLSCITGIDNGKESDTMELIYTLYSIPFNHSIQLKVTLPRENPEIETVSPIWKSAEWLEREVFDMYGISFLNHPDLRRILMPSDWEGFPLRKDYKEPDSYRGINLKDER